MKNKHNNDSSKKKDSNTPKRRSPSVHLSTIIIELRSAVSIIMSIYCVYEAFRLSFEVIFDINDVTLFSLPV